MSSLEFGLLGPLLVRRDGEVAVVRRGHQRTLLTVLLLNANRAVTVNDIADILWDAAPPPSAQVTIRNYVKRLRQALGDADRTRISSQPPGYMITVSDGEIDVSRCEALLAAARAAARDGRWDQAATQARAALSLWRGEPLADVESDALVLREVPRLAEMHLQALEVRIDAEVHLGRHDEVIAELRRLINVYPLREQFHVLLMLALYRHGQQGEALAAYQCSRLPLALRVAAELACTRGDVPLARLVEELADQQQRLSLLDAGGDPHTAIRAVFSWSYRHLDTVAARAFRLAGLHPGADFGPHAVAALTSATLADSRGVLDLLVRKHLIQQPTSGRYGMHDLLRAYARELGAAHDDQDGQHTALTRLLDHYLHTAAAAMDTLHPAERHRRPRISPARTPAPPVTEPTAALAWLDGERANLVAITAHAAGHGWPAHATRLAATLFRYLAAGSYTQEAIIIFTHARAAARQTGDDDAEATALNYIASDIGDKYQQARAHDGLAHAHHALASPDQARDHWAQALTLYTHLGTPKADQVRAQLATAQLPGSGGDADGPRGSYARARASGSLDALDRMLTVSTATVTGRLPVP